MRLVGFTVVCDIIFSAIVAGIAVVCVASPCNTVLDVTVVDVAAVCFTVILSYSTYWCDISTQMCSTGLCFFII